MRPIFIAMLAAAIAAGSVSAATAADVSGKVTFDSASDLSLFHVNGTAVSSVSGGLGGSGAISNGNPSIKYPGTRLTYQPSSFSMHNATDTLLLSTMFRYTQITQLSNGGGIGLDVAGFRLFADPNPSGYLARGLSVAYHESQGTIGGPITRFIDIFSNRGSAGTGAGYPIGALTDGHWNRLSTTFSFNASHQNQFIVALDDFGTTGLSFVSTHAQLNQVSPNIGVFDDSTAWAGIVLGQANGKGGDRHDDFIYQVPEPDTATLAALGAVGVAAWGCLHARRRRSWRSPSRYCSAPSTSGV